MASPAQWAKGYARQAHADFQSWQSIESNEVVHPCHRMLFEYPWEDDAQALHSPLDWAFSPLHLLRGPFGPTFVKVLRLAINRRAGRIAITSRRALNTRGSPLTDWNAQHLSGPPSRRGAFCGTRRHRFQRPTSLLRGPC